MSHTDTLAISGNPDVKTQVRVSFKREGQKHEYRIKRSHHMQHPPHNQVFDWSPYRELLLAWSSFIRHVSSNTYTFVIAQWSTMTCHCASRANYLPFNSFIKILTNLQLCKICSSIVKEAHWRYRSSQNPLLPSLHSTGGYQQGAKEHTKLAFCVQVIKTAGTMWRAKQGILSSAVHLPKVPLQAWSRSSGQS